MKESIETLKREIRNVESILNSMKKELEQLESENIGGEDKSFLNVVPSKGGMELSKVVEKGDPVRMYGIDWYVLNTDKDSEVTLIIQDYAMVVRKNYDDSVIDFCNRLHNISKEYVEHIKGEKRKLYTKVRSCTIHDIDKYLGKIVNNGSYVGNNIWNIDEYYWLPGKYNTLHHVTRNGRVNRSGHNTYRVRPVVSLKSDVLATGKDSDGVWILEE